METYHWDFLAMFHRDVIGCFILDVPATSLGCTERRHYDVATTSCCRVGPFQREHKKLTVNNNNILVRSTKEIPQIVIPPSLKWNIYQELYKNIAHLEVERSYHLAKSRVYWPNMEKDINFFIDSEWSCLTSKKQHIIPHAPLRAVIFTSPMDIIAIDSLKVNRVAGGCEYILVMIY